MAKPARPTILLLPGLDGTGDLFAPFIAAAPPELSLRTIALPGDRVQSYEELAEWLLPRLPEDDVVLVAESFSGPLAILIAAGCARVRGIILSTTFVEPPLPRMLALCPEHLWRRPPPAFVLRLALTGGDAALAAAVERAMRRVQPAVVAARVAAVLRVDVTHELQRLACPVLCLRARSDRLVGARSAARIQRLKPDAEIVHMDGPHLLLQAQPVEVWSRVAPFLARIVGRDASHGGAASNTLG